MKLVDTYAVSSYFFFFISFNGVSVFFWFFLSVVVMVVVVVAGCLLLRCFFVIVICFFVRISSCRALVFASRERKRDDLFLTRISASLINKKNTHTNPSSLLPPPSSLLPLNTATRVLCQVVQCQATFTRASLGLRST